LAQWRSFPLTRNGEKSHHAGQFCESPLRQAAITLSASVDSVLQNEIEMKKTIIILSVFVLIANSCGNRQRKTANDGFVGEQDNILVAASIEQQHEKYSYDTIEVNYELNKEILEIFLHLPDSIAGKWWQFNDIEERRKWYDEIKSNNFLINIYPTVFRETCREIYFKPNSARFQNGDVFFTISLYKTLDNSFIVITHHDMMSSDAVGLLHAYEVKENIFIEKCFFSLFGDWLELLKIENIHRPLGCDDKGLDEFLEELNRWYAIFDFSHENIVEICNPWNQLRERFENCLKGNTIVYRFNPTIKKFDIDKIYWK
jgi:hypothetical protein